jgi:hypothetical protein
MIESDSDENSIQKFTSNNNNEQSTKNESSYINSLGLAMEGKHGINMVSYLFNI